MCALHTMTAFRVLTATTQSTAVEYVPVLRRDDQELSVLRAHAPGTTPGHGEMRYRVPYSRIDYGAQLSCTRPTPNCDPVKKGNTRWCGRHLSPTRKTESAIKETIAVYNSRWPAAIRSHVYALLGRPRGNARYPVGAWPLRFARANHPMRANLGCRGWGLEFSTTIARGNSGASVCIYKREMKVWRFIRGRYSGHRQISS